MNAVRILHPHNNPFLKSLYVILINLFCLKAVKFKDAESEKKYHDEISILQCISQVTCEGSMVIFQ